MFCLRDTIFSVLTLVDLLCVVAIITLVMHNRYVRYGRQANLFIAAFRYYFERPFFAIKGECSTVLPSTHPAMSRGYLKRQWIV
jgi:hypothetical protein